MKVILTCFLLLVITGTGHAQSNPISTVDVVKGKQKFEKEVMFFYEQNWKAFRDEALRLGHISSYQLIRTATDSTGHFSLILITGYPDSLKFRMVEENFRPIMQKLAPKGPKMLNEVKRNEFLEYLTGFEGEVLFSR
jgi:hypothetical protein